ncbi:MAG: hypothetical protein Q8W46_10460 [Candidatus Palauibacterales bacterium]|jgi:hypothetical protein|nr:hypothetical protein [Candidatus Palauibacterales bacterium]
MTLRPLTAVLACALCLAALIPTTAAAQEDEPTPMIYGAYFKCDLSPSAGVSEIIRDNWGPLVQAHIDAGDLTAWGSLVHGTGGAWSRAIYMVGMDRAKLFDAVDGMVAEWGEKDPESLAAFWDACGEHEDYIWNFVTGSAPAQEVAKQRPSTGMSTYWVCDENHEALADLLLEEVYAEPLNAQVESGLIDSWSWFAHFMGDKYRRLLVTDGASEDAVLTARSNVLEWVGEHKSELANEFAGVCNGHVDYLWNIEMSAP